MTEKPCHLAPRHDPNLQGFCTRCGQQVGEPWYMQRRPEPAELVVEIARRAGVYVSPATGRTIADALLDYADSSYEVRQLVDRREWADDRWRERILADLRRRLLDEVTSQGRIPTALPSQAIRYPEAGADYESVEITLAVQCRTPAIDRAAAVRAGLL